MQPLREADLREAETTRLAEAYLVMRRRGAAPLLEEYVNRYPSHAAALAELLPILLRLEDAPVLEAGSKHGDSQFPERLGDYRLIRELGRGGMGVVFEAVQERLGRRVALKVLPAERLGGEQAWKRFRREAEIASRLDHSGICAVFDAETERGLPYIAMRFVEGRSLAELLEEARAVHSGSSTALEGALFEDGLPRKRSALVRIVGLIARTARALHAAHEAGIVHRDVKPANIMVTGDHEPVLLDFGLAHDASDDTSTLTGSRDLLGTPAYMSPEQISGKKEEPDRRTDVWALGATLYECLTLCRPFAEKTREALYHAILARDPRDPCAINPSIDGELVSIVRVALEKERAHRYADAEVLAADLEAWCAGRAVSVRPLSRYERARRWSRRHPAAAVFSTLSTGVLVLLPASWIWQEMRTQVAVGAERDRGTVYLKGACEAVESMLTNLGMERFSAPSTDANLDRKLFETALSTYEQFLTENGLDPRVRFEAAKAQRHVAFIHERLGREVEAEPHLRQAIDLLQAALDEGVQQRNSRALLATCQCELGYLLRELGRLTESAEAFRSALANFQIKDANVDELDLRHGEARAHRGLAILELQSGHLSAARAEDEQAIEILRELRTSPDWGPEQGAELASALGALASELAMTGEHVRAEALLTEAVEIGTELVRELPQPQFVYTLAKSERELARLCADTGRLAQAKELLGSATGQLRRLHHEYPSMLAYAEMLALVLDELGSVRVYDRDAEGASEPYKEALDLRQELADASPQHVGHRLLLAQSLSNYGWSMSASDPALAREKLEAAIAIEEELVRNDAAAVQPLEDLVNAKSLLAVVLLRLREVDGAEGLFRQVLDQRRSLLDRLPERPDYHFDLGVACHNLGRFLREERGDLAGALELELEGIDHELAARAVNPAEPRYAASLRGQFMMLGQTILELEDHALLADQVERWMELRPIVPDDAIQAAAYLSRSIPLAEVDPSLSETERAETAERYATRGLDLIRTAIDLGFANYELLRDSQFEVLQLRQEFDAILGR